MMKRLLPPGLFLTVMIIITYFFLTINAATPVLMQGQEVPEEIGRHFYILSGGTSDIEGEHYCLSIGKGCPSLALVISDMGAVTVQAAGETLYASTPSNPYARVQTAVISQRMLVPGTQLILTIKPGQAYDSPREVLTQTSIAPYKVLLSSAENAALAESVSMMIISLTMGVYAVAMGMCAILYLGKRTETYLLLLSVISGLCLLTSMFTANMPMMPFSFSNYAFLRPLLSLCPLVVNVAVCFEFCSGCLPDRICRLFSLRSVAVFTGLLLVLRLAIGASFYTPVRLLLILPIIWALSQACASQLWGAWLLLFGYALSESMLIPIFIINNLLGGTHVGMLMSYLNLNHMGYLPMLLSALVVVCHRFAEKFRESELLTGKLQAINAELDQKVVERTQLLTEEHARRQAMMLNILHDIRSPLFVVQGSLDQLHIPEADRGLMEVIGRKLRGLNCLVEDLFMFSKLEDDGVFYEEDRLDAQNFAESLFLENTDEAARRGIVFSLSGNAEGAMLWADELRLRRAFQNLIDNAFTYTRAGGKVQLTIQADETRFILSVADSGKGIAPEDLPHVFERYFSVSRKDNPKSSGLGLSIAREIILHSCGTVEATSVKGKGTCFTVTLPRLRE